MLTEDEGEAQRRVASVPQTRVLMTALLALAYRPLTDLRWLVAGVATLQAVAVGIAAGRPRPV